MDTSFSGWNPILITSHRAPPIFLLLDDYSQPILVHDPSLPSFREHIWHITLSLIIAPPSSSYLTHNLSLSMICLSPFFQGAHMAMRGRNPLLSDDQVVAMLYHLPAHEGQQHFAYLTGVFTRFQYGERAPLWQRVCNLTGYPFGAPISLKLMRGRSLSSTCYVYMHELR